MNTKQQFDFDPILGKISHHIPEEEITLLFPLKKMCAMDNNRFSITRRGFLKAAAAGAGVLSLPPDLLDFKKWVHAAAEDREDSKR